MSFIRVNEVGGDSLERVNKLLHNIPGGVYKAAFSALRRAGDTAKTRAGQFAAAEYTINKGEFMRRVHSKTHITGGAGGVMGMSISFSGTVLPLLTFNTTYSRDGTVQTQVKRNGGAATLQHAFVARIFGPTARFRARRLSALSCGAEVWSVYRTHDAERRSHREDGRNDPRHLRKAR